jgi:hypothetical protein
MDHGHTLIVLRYQVVVMLGVPMVSRILISPSI